MAWWIWMIVALVLGIVEVSTMTFVILWIAVAALATAVLTPVITNAWAQLGLFAVASVVLLVITRPLTRRWRQHRTYPERNETLIGEEGVVVNSAEPGSFALVRVRGELWSARTDHKLLPGQRVRVTDASTTVLSVDPIGEDE